MSFAHYHTTCKKHAIVEQFSLIHLWILDIRDMKISNTWPLSLNEGTMEVQQSPFGAGGW